MDGTGTKGLMVCGCQHYPCEHSTAPQLTSGYVESPNPPAQYGWICPKCGAVHAPFMPSCSQCGPGKPIAAGTTVDYKITTAKES